jgi:hypothetical protein
MPINVRKYVAGWKSATGKRVLVKTTRLNLIAVGIVEQDVHISHHRERTYIRRPCLSKNNWTSTECAARSLHLNRRLYFQVGHGSKRRRPRACVYTTQFPLLLCMGHASSVLQCTRPDQTASVLNSEGTVYHEYISEGQGISQYFWFGSTEASPWFISPQMTKKMTVWYVTKSVKTTHRRTRPNSYSSALCSAIPQVCHHRHLPSPDSMWLLPYLPN